MKKTIGAILFIILVVAAGILISKIHETHASSHGFTSSVTNETLPITSTIITLRGRLYVRLATTQAEQELGLSYFPSLPPNQGMLFLFPQSQDYPFWMKAMNFPLDMVWLRKTSTENTFQVVYVAENVSPDTYPNLIDPKMDADAVLEINAHAASFNDIYVGGPSLILRNYVSEQAGEAPVLSH